MEEGGGGGCGVGVGLYCNMLLTANWSNLWGQDVKQLDQMVTDPIHANYIKKIHQFKAKYFTLHQLMNQLRIFKPF